MESKSVSDAPKIDFKPFSNSQPYVSTELSERANFITLSKIPEEEQIKIIQPEFQR